MSRNSNKEIATLSPAEIKSLLGPAPILGTESADRFEKLFDQLIETFQLRDMVEAPLVWDFAVASWEISRYTRHRTLSFDRSYRRELHRQVEKIKGQRIMDKAPTTRLALNLDPSQLEVEGTIRHEGRVDSPDSEIYELINRTPTELDHSYALEKGISFHRDVEFLIASLTKRRNGALEMLEFYRTGLGKRVDDTLNEIIEAEYRVIDEQPEQVGSPPVVPSEAPNLASDDVDPLSGKNEGNNDLGTPDSREPAQQPKE
jgi:hypothetical protein